MTKIKVKSFTRKNPYKGQMKRVRVKSYIRKKRPKGKKKKLTTKIYRVKVYRDEFGQVKGTKWIK